MASTPFSVAGDRSAIFYPTTAQYAAPCALHVNSSEACSNRAPPMNDRGSTGLRMRYNTSSISAVAADPIRHQANQKIHKPSTNILRLLASALQVIATR